MKKILTKGDEIRVIAPSRNWGSAKYRKNYERAAERLRSLGYKITYGNYIKEELHFGTAPKEKRAKDFNDAYKDKNVKLVMASSGGWSANEILPLIDWKLVKNNPKPLIGFSDITVLLNSIYAKTGQMGFLGPNLSTFGRKTQWKYTLENFKNVVYGNNPALVKSKFWGDGGKKDFKTKPWKTIQKGEAEALALGGNIGSFYLLQGTEYQPKFDKPFIFLFEDDDEASKYTKYENSRRLESLLQLPGFKENIKGLIIGRYQKTSKVSANDIISTINTKELGNIPIVYDIDYGHTLPMLTLPIGGKIRLYAGKRVTIQLV